MPSVSVATKKSAASLREFECERLTLFFQKYTAFGHHDWNVAVDIALPFVVEQADCNIGVAYTLLQRYTKYALSY